MGRSMETIMIFTKSLSSNIALASYDSDYSACGGCVDDDYSNSYVGISSKLKKILWFRKIWPKIP